MEEEVISKVAGRSTRGRGGDKTYPMHGLAQKNASPNYLGSIFMTHSEDLFLTLFTTSETGYQVREGEGWSAFTASWVARSGSSHALMASSPSRTAGILSWMLAKSACASTVTTV